MEEEVDLDYVIALSSPQREQNPAFVKANEDAVHKLQNDNIALRQQLDAQNKKLNAAVARIGELEAQLQRAVDEIYRVKDVVGQKNAIIAEQNDQMRAMAAEKEKKNKYVSGSESDSLDDDPSLEFRVSRNRKRKGKNIPGKEYKAKKSVPEINGLANMEHEEVQSSSNQYDSNFPALGKGGKEIQERKSQEVNKMAVNSESVAPGKKQASQVSKDVNDNVKFQRNARGNNLRPRQTKVPPVILREKSRYNEVTAGFKAKKINFVQATTLPEGVKIVPSTSEDFRAMTRYLDDIKAEYHSYQLPEDKLLHVVLRGVLESFTEEEIEADLKAQGFSPKKVLRWKYKDGNPMPMVLVMVPKEDKSIFNVTNIKQNSVKVESQKVKSRITQCFNCQMFGHSSFGCRAKPKCVRCGEEHRSQQCKKPKTRETAKCANCAGNHPASFGGCPKHPKHFAIQQKNAPQRKEFKWGTQDNAKIAANPENMGAAMNSINQMNAAMQQFFKNLQMMQQQFASTFMSGPSTSKA